MANIQIHPFRYFLNINEQNQLELVENRFYADAYEEGLFSKKEGWAEYVIDGDNSQCYIGKVYFKDYIKNLFISEKLKCLEQIDTYLMPYQEKEIRGKIKLLKSSWVSIKDKASKNATIKKYKLATIYDEIEQELNNKLIFLDSKEKQSPYPKGDTSFEKLTWTGTQKQLCNVLFGLAKEHNDKGKFWINTTASNLEQFIVSSFVMADGSELSLSTIKTYLKPNKVTKNRKVDKDVELDKLIKK